MRSIFGISARHTTQSRGSASGTGLVYPSAKLTRFSTRRLIVQLLIASLTSISTGLASAGALFLFDDTGYLGDATLMPDWSATMARQQDQVAVLDACLLDSDACPRHYRGLRHLLLKAQGLETRQQIKLVNHYVNRKRYRADRSARLETDLSDQPVKYKSRWSTVEEFMRRGGDCEDFATTKYYLLRRLGFAAEHLRVVVTWDRRVRGYHGILAVNLDSAVWLLESDNTIRRGKRHAYKFIYSVNENSIWDHEAQASVSRPTHQAEEPAA